MTIWMPLAALPYFALYTHNMRLMGYRPVRDLIRVYALNLLLIPVHLTGAVTSVRQALAGTKIPFRRTPKVSGRTRTSGMDLALQLVMVGMSAVLGIYYASQTRWISGTFALVNAALLLYGIKQFIGFAEFRQDLWLSAQERFKSAALSEVPTRMPGVGPPSIASLAVRRISSLSRSLLATPCCVEHPPSRLKRFPGPASLAQEPSLNPIQLENQRSGTSAWMVAEGDSA